MWVQEVNIWELITSIAQKEDDPNYQKCKDILILNSQYASFGNELSLKISDNGIWQITIFSTDCPNSIKLIINKEGHITISRDVDYNLISDRREINF